MRKQTDMQKFEMYSKFAADEAKTGYYMAAYHAVLAAHFAYKLGLAVR